MNIETVLLVLESILLAAMFEDNFLKCWEESTGYEAYVREVIKETGASAKQLAREIHVEEKELERIAAQ